ncbi:MAG: helix-turn-helix transcriptional regulator [Candidatus Helarchaeota archaeon]|nr:helix-turn-helix transcriptional regulator [Candidatus Helarchaeota archaeon]
MDTTSVLGFCDFQAIREYVENREPTLRDIWNKRFEVSEKNVMKGRLHENHLLGIFLWFYVVKKEEIITEKINEEYEKFFDKVSRSTISTYLNQLEKQGILTKNRQGKQVFYRLTYEPPKKTHPIYVVRNFCMLPSYLCRASFFSRTLRIDREVNLQFLLELINLSLIKNRIEKCIICPLAIKKDNEKMGTRISSLYRTKTELLPKELFEYINNELGELSLFGGGKIVGTWATILGKLMNFSQIYKKEIKFQREVFSRKEKLK